MSDLPNDWEIYAGIAFHALIPRMGSIIRREELIQKSVELGLEMARAIEKKEDETWEQSDGS